MPSIPSCDTLLTGTDVINGKRPAVYAWVRDEKILYIGQSQKVFNRLSTHTIIDTPINAIIPTDKIYIWYFDTQEIARKNEMELIILHKPKLNTVWSEANITCAYCGKEFEKTRTWHKFCSQPCRTGQAQKVRGEPIRES